MHSQHSLDIFSVASNDPSELLKQVTQKNRQQLFSIWLAHQQEKRVSQDWTQGESKHTGPFAATRNQLVEGLGWASDAIDDVR